MLRLDVTNQVTASCSVSEINHMLDMFFKQNLGRWCEISSQFEELNCHVLIKMVDEQLPSDVAAKIANIPPEEGNDSNYLTYIVSQSGDAVIILNMLLDEVQNGDNGAA